MTPVGHVTMDGKEYRLRSLPVQVLANQMAPKVGSGESEYSSLDTWSAWIMEDWSGGVGKTRPHRNDGGFLFGTCETRVPNQIILPQVMHSSYVLPGTGVTAGLQRQYMPDNEPTGYTSVTVGTGGYTKLAVKIDADDWPTEASTYGQPAFLIDTGGLAVTISIEIYSDNAGTPDTSLGSGATSIVSGVMGPYWGGDQFFANETVTTAYWLVISLTSGTSIQVYGGTGRAGSPVTKSYDGASWTSRTFYPFFTHGSASSGRHVFGGIAAGEVAVFIAKGTGTYAYYTDNETSIVPLVTVHATAQSGNHRPTYALDRVYVATDGNAHYTTLAGAAGVDTTYSTAGGMVRTAGGFLWRTVNRSIYYSADGTTWVQPTDTSGAAATLGNAPYVATGLAELDGITYVATSEGLYAVMPGDFLTWVGKWGQPNDWTPTSAYATTGGAPNGKGMLAWQGSLYMIVNDRVWRYTSDGSLQDIWVDRDDDFPSDRLGIVTAIGVGSNGIFAVVQPLFGSGGETAAYGVPTVWTMPASGTGWHYVGQLSGVSQMQDVFYDNILKCIWVTGHNNRIFRSHEAPYAVNPYNDPTARFMPAGWIEWDWYRGTVREADKDWESVTLMGTFSATETVKVYWKDTDSTAWELLGTITSDGQELRWPVGTRPNSTKIKIGLLLTTTTRTETPKVEGIRVKYHMMVRDWFRWNLSIDVSGGQNGAIYQEMLNGEPNLYTADEIKANVDALATAVAPFLYTDIDGSQYQVKMKEATFQYARTLYNDTSADKEWDGVYNVVIEQVTQGTYSA